MRITLHLALLLLTGVLSFFKVQASNTSLAIAETGSILNQTQIQASKTVYVAAAGNDANTGTLAAPYKTITKAVNEVLPGDTIFVRGGNHTYTATITINKNGNEQQKIHLFAYPGERPVLDFSGLAFGSSNRGINLNGSYWHLKGLDIFKAGDNGMFVKGSYNLVEQCNFYENSDTGLQLGGGAAHNRIINCDSYFNADPGHGNADGFAPKLDVGTGNYFYGCRAWQNSDDGWDGYMRGNDDVTTTLENCWVFKSGYLKSGSKSSGNGNGFKMGGSDNKDLKHNMVLINCLAFDNVEKGFDQNNNKGAMTIYNGTAFNNGRNYTISLAVATGKTVKVANSVSAGTGTVTIGSFVQQQTNSWNLYASVALNNFMSTNSAEAYAPRKADGSLPNISFMHLRPESTLIDKGTNVGIPYAGIAPDLGSFEYGFFPLAAQKDAYSKGQLQVVAIPNPASGNVLLQFSSIRSGTVIVRLYAATGQQLAILYNKKVTGGEIIHLPLTTDVLPAGLYFVTLAAGSQKQTAKLLLTK